MNLRTTGIIISREYLNKVRKKSFLVTTFLVPVLFAAMCLLPTLIMLGAKESAKEIAVVDRSGIVTPFLTDSESVTYTFLPSADPDSVKQALAPLGFDALLTVSELDAEARSVTADVYSLKPLGMDIEGSVNSRINDAVEAYRIETSGIDNLKQIISDIRPHVKLTTYTLDSEGKETVSESGVYMVVSMVLGMVIYLFIALFGGMVMSSVIEEKSSRVIEVLVSSVKATELMFGKILGVVLVALTQFMLWIVLTVSIIALAGAIAGPSMGASPEAVEAMLSTPGLPDGTDAVTQAVAQGGDMGVIFSTLSNLPVGTILVCFIVFFVFGYLLYSSLFAAIGSAVENEGDSQQLQIPLTIPLLVGFFIAIYAFKAPDSALVFWGSMIPFTSPIVMLARLPFGVPAWEILLSMALLVLTFVVCAWLSAKIYRVGILTFGKKASWKDLYKWLKLK